MATRDRKRFVDSDGHTIATTGNSDQYVIAPVNGILREVIFSGVDALAANNTNFISFTVVNLGQAGAGTAAMIVAGVPNTTQVTGGSAIAANTRRNLTVSSVAADVKVQAGDRIRIRAAATGTLANTVTGAKYQLRFDKTV